MNKPTGPFTRAALYLRLSKDDEGAGESASITTQREILRDFARENHFPVAGEYVDDGYSGTTFERPAFQRMIRDIELGNINLVLTKDLSRLGRDYITTGQYTEIYFPLKGVRYIAVNDGYDSQNPGNDMAPFQNIVNEMYARDTSRKIRSAFEARMRRGEFIGSRPPYGYRRDPGDRRHLVPDEEAAGIVRRIFSLAASGSSPKQIAQKLTAQAVLSPGEYREQQSHALLCAAPARAWIPSTVGKILRNPVYLGHMVQGKTRKPSLKSKACARVAKENWCVVKHTHEPLVSEEQFSLAAQACRARVYPKEKGFVNRFSKLARCMDCGAAMSSVGTRKQDSRANLACGAYKQEGKKACTNHFIEYEVLEQCVLYALRREMEKLSEQEKQSIFQKASERLCFAFPASREKHRSRQLSQRKQSIEKMVRQVYEDSAAGLLNEQQRQSILLRYREEEKRIDREISTLAGEPVLPNVSPDMVKQRFAMVLNAGKLEPGLLYRLVERIEIGQGEFVQSEDIWVKRQRLFIRFRFRRNAAGKTAFPNPSDGREFEDGAGKTADSFKLAIPRQFVEK